MGGTTTLSSCPEFQNACAHMTPELWGRWGNKVVIIHIWIIWVGGGVASSLTEKAKGSSDSHFTFGWIWSSLKEDTIDSFDQPGLLNASGHHDCVFWVLVYKENQDSNFCIVICLKILNSILMHPLLGAGGVSGELWQLVSAIHEEAMVWYFVNDKDMTALNCVPHLRSVPAVSIQEQRNV
jgi:hypothetical protein